LIKVKMLLLKPKFSSSYSPRHPHHIYINIYIMREEK
jgi:hypothetical protein